MNCGTYATVHLTKYEFQAKQAAPIDISALQVASYMPNVDKYWDDCQIKALIYNTALYNKPLHIAMGKMESLVTYSSSSNEYIPLIEYCRTWQVKGAVAGTRNIKVQLGKTKLRS